MRSLQKRKRGRFEPADLREKLPPARIGVAPARRSKIKPAADSILGRFSFHLSCALAEATGFEPAVSALTGLHVRPLHHASSGI